MARFITELSAEIPKIILITDEPTLVLPTVEIIKNQKLEPLVLSLAQALSAHVEAEFAAAYKIAWFMLPAETTQVSANQTTLAGKLANWQDKTFVITTRSSGIAQPSESSIADLIKHYLSKATVLVGRDVVETTGQLNHPVLKQMLRDVSHGVLLDPITPLFLQTWSAFAQSLGFKLLKPRVASVEIQGKKSQSTVVAKLISLTYQRLFGSTLEIKDQGSAKPMATLSLPEEVTLFPETPEQVIQELLPWLQKHPPSFKAPVIPNSQPGLPSPVAPAAFSKPVTPTTHTPLTSAPLQPIKQIKPLVSFKTAPSPKVISGVSGQAISKPTPKATNLVELESDLSHLFQDYRTEKKQTHVTKLVKETRSTTRRSLRKERMFWFGMIGMAILAALVAFYGFFWLTLFQLKNQINQTNQAIQVQTDASYSTPPVTNFWLTVGKAQASIYGPLLAPLGFDDATTIIGFSENINQLQLHQQALLKNSSSLFLAMMNRYPTDVSAQLTATLSQSQSLYQDISLAQTFLKDMSSDILDDQALQKLKTQLNVNKKSTATIQTLQPILGDLIGLNGKRTYAVVFQNNQELRATGGVIQSVGFVTVDHGLIIDTQTLSAAQIDAHLTGTALPPADVAKYLGDKNWHFEDVTWNPDAVATSQEITLFLEKATRFNVDGVILTNTNSLQEWLKVVGPVDVPEYKEEITDKNLSERLEAHSELQVDGDQSQEYSTLLLQHLLQKTFQVPQEKLTDLFATIYRQAEAKQLTFYMRRANELAAFDSVGWTGALLSPSCPAQLQQANCYVDPAFEVESNVGVNKANIYIDRQTSDTITIADGLIKHDRKLSLTNKAVSNAWPRGTYKAFIRLYVAPSATLDSITVNGQIPNPKEFSITAEQNRTVYGVYLEVPIQEQTELEITYSELASTDSAFSYSLFNQFQSGLNPPPFKVSITAPNHRPTLIAPQAQVTDGQIVFNSPGTLDTLLGVKYE